MTSMFATTSRRISPRHASRGILDTILAWGNIRQQRLDLANLDAKGLADIGVSAREAGKEIRKPFWMMPGFR